MKLSFLKYCCIILLYVNSSSCISQVKIIDNQSITELSIDLLERIIVKEELNKKTFSATQYFHCNVDILNENTYLYTVTLNQHLPIQEPCMVMNVKDIKTFIYFNCKSRPLITEKLSKSNVDPFFVPDSYNSNFLIEKSNNYNRIRYLSDYIN